MSTSILKNSDKILLKQRVAVSRISFNHGRTNGTGVMTDEFDGGPRDRVT